MPTAWVLNFDAEIELASPERYSGTPRPLQKRFERLESNLSGLVAPGDVVIRPGSEPSDGRAESSTVYRGDSWCPTPSALRRLRRFGASLPDSPSLEVLRRVNDRGFCAALGQRLPGATFARAEEEVDARLGRDDSGWWLLKRAFGFSGRGRRRVAAGRLSEVDRAWIRASLRGGLGLQVEPFVDRVSDYCIHGRIGSDGTLALGPACVQNCDDRGAWLQTREALVGELQQSERDLLVATATDVAQALVAAEYFGPFGIDAYRWRDERGETQFHPCSEINARYTMGWAIGMKDARARR